MGKHFLIVTAMAALASIIIRLFITHANVTAAKIGLRG